MTDTALKIYSLAEAKASILKRRSLDAFEIPPALVERSKALFGEAISPDETVRRILKSVQEKGDEAVRDWTKRLDGVELDDFAIPDADLKAALKKIPTDVLDALQLATQRIQAFHRLQPLQKWVEQGVGQIIRPLARIGIYVPGGTAPLPSSLLMCAIPARVADVKEIIICTPPGRESGQVPDVMLAAAALAGVNKVYRIGGVQAIGAMAFGTATIPPVDKIFGPGNLFVTLAKRQVFGLVGIDGLPGPTETMIIADETANPRLAAADLLAQAEHDVLATAILLTPSRTFAEAVVAELQTQLAQLDRADIIRQSLQAQGGVVLVEDLVQAFDVANTYAPEHLCLLMQNPVDWTAYVQNAGGVFLGEHSFEVLGDYVAGPSHIMPTSGTARFASPINLWDFVKITSLINLDPKLAAELSPAAAIFARAEGLSAHAAAAEARVIKE